MNQADEQRFLARFGYPPSPRPPQRFTPAMAFILIAGMVSVFWLACDARPKYVKQTEKEKAAAFLKAEHEGASKAIEDYNRRSSQGGKMPPLKKTGH